MFKVLNSLIRRFSDLPPHTKLGMPSLSPTMTTGTIVKWLKKEGDKVKAGESMFEVETDKATVAFEVQDDVYLAKILANAGSAPLPLGAPVAILVDKSDRLPAFANFQVSEKPETSEKPEPESQPKAEEAKKEPQNIKISPAAHSMIHAKHLDIGKIKATGPKGLILKEDVLNYLEAGTKEPVQKPPAEVKPKTSSGQAGQSEVRAPRFSVTNFINLEKYFELFPADQLNAFLVKAASSACRAVPEANSKFFTTFTRFYDYVDTQVYVYGTGGVKKYYLQDCQGKNVREISDGLTKEGDGKANFEVSFGNASEVATPKASSLLSIGSVQEQVFSSENGLKNRKVVKATLNCDHRSVDGAVGANWLKAFKQYVENPVSLI